MRALLQAVAGLFALLPRRLALATGRGLGFVAGRVIRHRRAEARRALERSLRGRTKREYRAILNRMYAHLGMNLVESLRMAGTPPERWRPPVAIEGEEHVRRALERGRGALVLTAHLGNWDVLSGMTTRLGFPLTIISKDVKNRAVNRFWMDTRARYGLDIVPAHGSYRACRAALRKNGLVGFILDQNMISDEGVFVDFFGRPACTTPGLAYMAAQSGAPVIPVFITRENDGHRIRVQPPLEPPPDRKPETVREATQTYTRIIEEAVRAHPEEWIWIHRRWRTQPPSG